MEAFVVACSLLILASVAFFLLLGFVEKVVIGKRLGVCARCGSVIEYSRWRTPPWCASCDDEVWRAEAEEPLAPRPHPSA